MAGIFEEYGLEAGSSALALACAILESLEEDCETDNEMLVSLIQLQEVCWKKSLLLSKNPLLQYEMSGWGMLGVAISNRLHNHFLLKGKL